MIHVGQYNKLRIDRDTTVGLFLEDEDGEDVLLPNKYCPENYELDDMISVFVYRDHDGKKIATNLEPQILLNQFALLKVEDVSPVGAFVQWGMIKHLLVPFKEQRQKMEKGRWYLVYMLIDEKTDRLIASNKLNKFLSNDELSVSEGDKVSIIIMNKSDLGYNVIINHKHLGLLYENEVFENLYVGQVMEGFIKKIREDNKIDVSLQPTGYKQFNDLNVQKIYDCLLENEGAIFFTDKSASDDIRDEFGMSKKAFKKAIGALYKDKKILILPDRITLV